MNGPANTSVSERRKGTVSVIIPTFNRIDMLAETIQSVRSQSYANTEIIVVDDGSKDGTREKFETHDGIIYLHQENAGPSAARNRGIRKASGEYLAFLDSDDRWESGFLTECVRELESTGAGFAFANWNVIDENDAITTENVLSSRGALMTLLGDSKAPWHKLSSLEIRELFILKTLVPPSGILFRRENYEHFWEESLSIGEDQFYVLQGLFAADIDVVWTKEIHWAYRLHQSNFYANNPEQVRISQGEIHAREKFLEGFENRLTAEQLAFCERTLAESYFDLGFHLLKKNERASAIEALQASWKLRPSIRTMKCLLKAKFLTQPASRTDSSHRI